jgi:hypothetical protein
MLPTTTPCLPGMNRSRIETPLSIEVHQARTATFFSVALRFAPLPFHRVITFTYFGSLSRALLILELRYALSPSAGDRVGLDGAQVDDGDLGLGGHVVLL